MKRYSFILAILLLFLSGCSQKYNMQIVKSNKIIHPIYSNISLFNRLYIKPFDNDKYGITSKVYNSFLESIFNNKPIIEKIYLVEKDFPKSKNDYGKYPILSGKVIKVKEKVTTYKKDDIDNKDFKVIKQCQYYQFWIEIEYNLKFPSFIDSKIIKNYRQYDNCKNGQIDSTKIKNIMIQYNIKKYIEYIKKEFKFKDENSI